MMEIRLLVSKFAMIWIKPKKLVKDVEREETNL